MKNTLILIRLIFLLTSISNNAIAQENIDSFLVQYGVQIDSLLKHNYKSEYFQKNPYYKKLLSDYNNWYDSTINNNTQNILKFGSPYMRTLVFQRSSSWSLLQPRPVEMILIFFFFLFTILLMCCANLTGYDNEQDSKTGQQKESLIGRIPPYRFLTAGKLNNVSGLFARDFGPLSFDVSTHGDKAEISEYRGLIHWFRDVIEKILSLFLIIGFSVFLSKSCGYMWDYLTGETWRLVLIPLEINIIIGFVGLTLIVDGLIIVSSMTDAPGIGRVLDAVIIVLAGVIVMFLQAEPGEISLVSFSLGPQPTIPLFIAFAIGFLFIIRWIVRHHTIAELKGIK